MRKIQFIAQDEVTGDWVSGYPLRDPDVKDRWYIMNNYSDGTIVRPETIREFTGLCDMNGISIYEGDIVQYKVAEQGKQAEFYSVRHPVRFDSGSFKAESHLSDWYNSEYPRLKDHLYRESGCLAGRDRYYIEFDIEVIGNIYEHKELLTN